MTNHKTRNQIAPWRHVWITGGSTGLGKHTALLLAQMGCRVSLTARSVDKLEALAQEHDNIHAYPADVNDHQSLEELVPKIEAAHGPIDLALLSAGIGRPNKVADLNVKSFIDIYNVNVFGVVKALECVLPSMLHRKKGHVAVIASLAGYAGLPRVAAYNSSKSALITIAQSLHGELADQGVVMSVINPGFVKTPLTEKNKFPMPFLMEVEDAAEKMVVGLMKRKFEIAFPWPLVWVMKLLAHLPYWLYLPIIKRLK